MNTVSKIGIAALLAGALAAPLALAQDEQPEAPAAGETMPGTGEGGMPGMMDEGGMPMMQMMRMMEKMGPMMEACMAMMQDADTASILNSRLNFRLVMSTLRFLGHDLIVVSTEPAAAQCESPRGIPLMPLF